MQYELMYIIPATKTEAEAQTVKGEVDSLLSKYAESVLRNELLHKLKLAYPISGVRYGYFVLVVFEAETEKIRHLDEELRHHKDVLRHLLTVAVSGADKAEIRLSEYEVPDTESRKKAEDKKPPVRQQIISGDAPIVQLTDEQLDKQLDKILESDIDKI